MRSINEHNFWQSAIFLLYKLQYSKAAYYFIRSLNSRLRFPTVDMRHEQSVNKNKKISLLRISGFSGK